LPARIKPVDEGKARKIYFYLPAKQIGQRIAPLRDVKQVDAGHFAEQIAREQFAIDTGCGAADGHAKRGARAGRAARQADFEGWT
jgi:hypothetical protein